MTLSACSGSAQTSEVSQAGKQSSASSSPENQENLTPSDSYTRVSHPPCQKFNPTRLAQVQVGGFPAGNIRLQLRLTHTSILHSASLHRCYSAACRYKSRSDTYCSIKTDNRFTKQTRVAESPGTQVNLLPTPQNHPDRKCRTAGERLFSI